MKVVAIERGFDGRTLRVPDPETGVSEEFNFAGFKLNDDGTHNLGSWMRLTDEGEKEFNKLVKALERKKSKQASKKQASKE